MLVAPVHMKYFLIALACCSEALPEDSGVCGAETINLSEGQTTYGKEFSRERKKKIDVSKLILCLSQEEEWKAAWKTRTKKSILLYEIRTQKYCHALVHISPNMANDNEEMTLF